MGIPGLRKPIAFVEDTAVDPPKLPEFVRRFREILHAEGTDGAFYGHASVGCLHIRPLIDSSNKDDLDRMRRILDRVSDLVLEFGGAMSGEHGDGLARSFLNEKLFGPQLYQAFKEVKAAFDPHGLLNPGKVVDGPSPVENLRQPPGYQPLEIADDARFQPPRGLCPLGRAVQRLRRLPQDADRHDVPLVHGHRRRGAQHARPGQRPAAGALRRAAAGGAHRPAAVSDVRSLPAVQRLQGGVSFECRRGQA